MEFRLWRWVFAAVLTALLGGIGGVLGSDYLIGMGSYDITGPAADVNMMGYANSDQIASGIHFRLRSRAFIVAETQGKRVVFVNLDACMASQIVTIKVLERLKARYGNLYNEHNVAISGIHTHAGPGGYLQYVVYIVTSLGFVRQSFDALILDASVNRSPSAYLNNPAQERRKYKYDVDKEMSLLKFVDDKWGSIGSFNWFATHGTSMSRTNSLISGDNKGTASRFMEDWFDAKNGERVYPSDYEGSDKIPRRVSNIISSNQEKHDELLKLAGYFGAISGTRVTKSSIVSSRVRSVVRQANKPRFVTAFCQSNCGDVSPNVLGAFCTDTGLPCDFNRSTCGGKNELCYGRGPGYPDEFESTRIIGQRQFKKAVELFNTATEKIKGKVDYRHAYVDFSKIMVTVKKIGGVNQTGNLFWKAVRNVLTTPSKEQVECQKPKPILLDTGEMKVPYDWAPSILPVQILKVGQFVILSVPSEFTTMAGRRLRDAVKAILTSSKDPDFDSGVHVVIAGLTNTYSQYVTTFEEYEVQRYEGASTLYGPHTLAAYIQEFTKLTNSLLRGQATEPGPQPPDLLNKQLSFITPVVADTTPPGVDFGDCSVDVSKNSTFIRGDKVEATFWTACPRNDLMTEGTFALVEMILPGTKTWVSVYDDDDFCLKYKWKRPFKLSPSSQATIEWRVPDSAPSGVYRIRHFGAAKALLGSIRYFTGLSSAFVVA
ncbi:hypothetical protein V2J09_006997 [Rumex salicifolius]